MDYGSDWQYCTSDITRSWPVSGRFTAEQEKMYRCVLEARNAIVAAMKPGVTIASLQIDISGPAAQKPFVAGTVFNVEPILEIPDRKIHIRLEDTIVVTENDADKVTAGVPADVESLYALIRQRGVNSSRVGSVSAQ
jgi:Xaa-Pro aminopeptidase